MNGPRPQAPFLSQEQQRFSRDRSPSDGMSTQGLTSSLWGSVSQRKDNNCSIYLPDLLPI